MKNKKHDGSLYLDIHNEKEVVPLEVYGGMWALHKNYFHPTSIRSMPRGHIE